MALTADGYWQMGKYLFPHQTAGGGLIVTLTERTAKNPSNETSLADK